MWCIPPEQDAAFVARMERVLDVYSRPYDARCPVCMDEQPYQLLSETRPPLPTMPGKEAIVDHEYVRKGCCAVWMFVEPLAGWRDVPVTSRRTAVDWAVRVRALVDEPRHADAERITLVCDNLNTHDFGSLYAAFDAVEAKRIMDRLELVFTPAEARQLAEHRGIGVERTHPPVPGRPPGQRGCRGGTGNAVGVRPEPPANRRGLAVHHRRRAHQAQAALPESQNVIEH